MLYFEVSEKNILCRKFGCVGLRATVVGFRVPTPIQIINSLSNIFRFVLLNLVFIIKESDQYFSNLFFFSDKSQRA